MNRNRGPEQATRATERIAIVGAGLRLPGGVADMDGLARLLWTGRDPVGPVPPSRWDVQADGPAATQDPPGSRWGAFLDDLDQFDAAFFGIAPREAASLDPQQRLLLEVGWEALENAGYDPRALAGTATGVFAGLATSDYGRAIMADRTALDAYGASGTAYGTAAGRLSYTLDLAGPCVAIDTACSSSLVAIHLAAQSLRLGESDLALAGGVNVILSPEIGIIYAKARMLSPDGRSRSFAADANGYVRGEGCCLLVLRRLDDALADGDRILGIIRGTAINQDGKSAGLTAPRGTAQQAVIAAALAAASAQPGDIAYVEAHGSGTPLGDTVEMAALGEALCRNRPSTTPLRVGSIKSNIGHLEAAGGAAGILKILLAFERASIPPNLHLAEPNPLIAWDTLPIHVAVTPEPWPRGPAPRLAGINSFGFGGTNAHLVLEEPPPRPSVPPTRGAHILPIAARTPEALADQVRRFRTALSDRLWPAACHTAALGRTHFAHRIAFVGATLNEICDEMDEFLALGRSASPPASPPTPPAIAFAIAAPRDREAETVARLAERVPAFAAHHADLLARAPGRATRLQPALAALLAAWGVPSPALVVRPGGHDDAALLGLPPLEDPAQHLVVELADIAGPDPWRALLGRLRTLYEAGIPLDWSAILQGPRPTPVPLPSYPFQRQRHWSPTVRAFADAGSTPPPPPARPFLSWIRSVPGLKRRPLLARCLLDALRPDDLVSTEPDLDRPFSTLSIDPSSADACDRVRLLVGNAFEDQRLTAQTTALQLAGAILDAAEAAERAAEMAADAAADNARRRPGQGRINEILARRASRVEKLR